MLVGPGLTWTRTWPDGGPPNHLESRGFFVELWGETRREQRMALEWTGLAGVEGLPTKEALLPNA